MKLNYPAKITPAFYLILIISFLLKTELSAQDDASKNIKEQALVYRDEGLKLQKEGDIDGAIATYQKAINLDPNYAVAYNDLGILFESKSLWQRAKEMYLKAIEIAPSYPNSYSNLALLSEEQKDYTNAILYWIRRSMLGGPRDPWAEVAKKRLEDIAKVYPDIYSAIVRQEYKEELKKPDSAHPFFNEKDFEYIVKKPLTEESELKTYAGEPQIESIVEEDAHLYNQIPKNKDLALSYLERARSSFQRQEYVDALREATLAEYLDSSNKEIGDFINKVRKALQIMQ